MTPFQHQLAAGPQRGAPPHEPDTAVLLQCLVVAANEVRREGLSWAASQSGWRPIPCSDAAAAKTCSRRSIVQLAIIDLEDPSGSASSALQELLEHLTRTGGLLLVVCGNEGQVAEEIWARQIGVWMYLPGVTDVSELATLLAEARHLAQRMAPVALAPPWERSPAHPESAAARFDRSSASATRSRRPWTRRNGP